MAPCPRRLLAAVFLVVSGPAGAEEIIPLSGCYEHVYDAAWLAAHPAQIVRRATLSVTKTSVPETPGETQKILADAELVLRTADMAFSTIGACYWDKLGLACNASLSAAESPLCKTKEDGVRNCRLSTDDPGAFDLTQKGPGLLLTIRERLELTSPLETRAFLYLSPQNTENRAFLLKPAPPAVCR
ncbi:hypothetical protein WOC76_09675 [Methylocystis sp. IM3]|uniref:hypothetical protein n=1 Tax=unclassified Methylocystis TaxID=2625913 RepID=UPI0026C3AD82